MNAAVTVAHNGVRESREASHRATTSRLSRLAQDCNRKRQPDAVMDASVHGGAGKSRDAKLTRSYMKPNER